MERNNIRSFFVQKGRMGNVETLCKIKSEVLDDEGKLY